MPHDSFLSSFAPQQQRRRQWQLVFSAFLLHRISVLNVSSSVPERRKLNIPGHSYTCNCFVILTIK
jgi:hypothetical protein